MKVTVRFDERKVTALDEIAEVTGVSRSEVMNSAVDVYIDYITWFKKEVQKGIDDIDAERVISQEQVEKRVNDLIQNRKKGRGK